MPARPLLLAALVGALILGACGNNAADEKAVKRTVKGVYDALADKDAGRVCDSISAEGKRKLARTPAAKAGRGQSCKDVFGFSLAFAGDALKQAKNAEVTDVTVEGDQAKATVRYRKRETDVGLVKERGQWKLSGLDLAGG
jgi:hypothetical protein